MAEAGSLEPPLYTVNLVK